MEYKNSLGASILFSFNLESTSCFSVLTCGTSLSLLTIASASHLPCAGRERQAALSPSPSREVSTALRWRDWWILYFYHAMLTLFAVQNCWGSATCCLPLEGTDPVFYSLYIFSGVSITSTEMTHTGWAQNNALLTHRDKARSAFSSTGFPWTHSRCRRMVCLYSSWNTVHEIPFSPQITAVGLTRWLYMHIH